MDNEILEKIAKALAAIGTHLKYLGTGDAATTMGAIECLAVKVESGCESIASAISELASAVREHGGK